MIDKFVMGMASLRLMGGSIELLAALLMFRFNDIEKALMINSALALVGPIILITTTALGVIGIADKLSMSRIVWIVCGILFLFIGILKN